jgi:hypothetical protein
MKSIQDAQQGLYNLKEDIIGIFRHSGSTTCDLVFSVNEESKTINSISISPYGMISQWYGQPISNGKLFLFPDGKNMNDMWAGSPFEVAKFLEQFK